MKPIACFVVLALSLAGCGGDGGSPTSPSPAPTLNVGFSTTDLRVGTGAEATAGRQVVVNYSGWIYSPTAPDNKGNRFQTGTFGPFAAGGPGAIAGFSQGVVGMRVGGLRRVVIPPNLGYGNNPPDASIRPNETLLFEIELLAVQ
jgi:FKBP-type peptidyl-prolyl cis-trans isomerase